MEGVYIQENFTLSSFAGGSKVGLGRQDLGVGQNSHGHVKIEQNLLCWNLHLLFLVIRVIF